MDLKLKGKRALVTGSTSGLGESIVKMLAAEGAEVIVHGRNIERAKCVADYINLNNGKATIAIGDLTSDEGADAVIKEALKNGKIDILVNNAGFYKHTSWTGTSADDWLEVYNANVVSYVRMIQRVLPQMKELGWGRLIHIGGGLGIQPIREQPHYNATLAARHNLSVSLARELKETGITSNVVSPGAIMNESVEEWLNSAAKQKGWGSSFDEIEKNAVKDIVPNDAGRFGRPEEIAAAVCYLASPYADYVSGALLRIDGGTVKGI